MKRIVGSVVIGILITSFPFALAALSPSTHWWRLAAIVCHWPMSLVKSANIGRNELNRLVFFFEHCGMDCYFILSFARTKETY